MMVYLPNTPMAISSGCQIVHLDHQNAKVLSSQYAYLGYVKLNGFHDNLLNNSKEWNVPTKILISQQQLIQDYKTWYHSNS